MFFTFPIEDCRNQIASIFYDDKFQILFMSQFSCFTSQLLGESHFIFWIRKGKVNIHYLNHYIYFMFCQ